MVICISHGCTVFILTSTAVVILLLVHTDTRNGAGNQSLEMAQVNVSGYGDALFSAFSYPILGLYTDNVSAPLHARAGLRQAYKFGLYAHCAYVNESAGLCTGDTIAYQFQPYTTITDDMLSNYSDYTNTILRNTAFANSSSLARSSRVACYLLLLGPILSIISLVIMPIRRGHNWAFFVSASAAVLAAISVFSGSAIWTIIVKKARDVNSRTIQPTQIPLGIEVHPGIGLCCIWIAFGLLVMSAIGPTIESASLFRPILTTPEP